MPLVFASRDCAFCNPSLIRVCRLPRFASRSVLTKVPLELIDRIPGSLSDRRTPLGELNWIFTAITDTIAWNVLPRGQNLSIRLFARILFSLVWALAFTSFCRTYLASG